MKSRFICIVLTLTSLFSTVSFAAEDSSASSGNTMNFRFDPVPLVIGAVFAHLDVQVSENWTVGPALKYWKITFDFDDSTTDEYEVSFFAAGARANWFKNGAYKDGLYLGPSVSYYNVKASSDDSLGGTDEDETSGVLVGGLVGYGWFWSSFNQMLGIGVVTSVGKSKTTVTDSNGQEEDVDTSYGTGLAFEYTLGWTF